MDEPNSKRTAPDPDFNTDVQKIVSPRMLAKKY
jgi:hypothetical protein